MSAPNMHKRNALVRQGNTGGWFGRLANLTFGNVTVTQETINRLRNAYSKERSFMLFEPDESWTHSCPLGARPTQFT